MWRGESYILSICLAAVMVAILSRIQDSNSSTGNLCRMLFGLFLAFTVLKPVGRVNFDNIEVFSNHDTVAANAATAKGEAIAKDTLSEIIKQKTEAYILDKAGLYECDIQVEVAMGESEPPVPESVVICGDASPYARAQLQRIIAEDLAIPKERQKWIG